MPGIDGRKIPENAVLDDVAFGANRDGLVDQEIAVRLHADVADKAQDAFIGFGRSECGEQQPGRDQKTFQAGHRSAPDRLTVGGALEAASVSKKCSSLMPSRWARSTSG